MSTHNKFCVHKECIINLLPAKERGNLFCFPRTDSLRSEWLINMNRIDLNNLTYRQLLDRGYRVCQLHFDDKQFQNELKLKLNYQQVPRPVFNPDADSADVPEDVLPMNVPNIIGQEVQVSQENEMSEKTPRQNIGEQSTADIYGPSCSTWSSPRRDENIEPSVIPESTSSGSPDRLTLKSLDVTRQKDLTPRKHNLYSRLRATKKLLSLSRLRGRTLSKKIKDSEVDVCSPKTLDHIENLNSLPVILRTFVISILKNFVKNKKARRYSMEEKSIFLSIMKHGPRCYRYLQKLLGLPSIRTLKRSLANFKLNTGINDRLFEYLNSVSENLKPEDRHCVVIFDEMEVAKSLEMCVSNGACRVEGFVDKGMGREAKLADHALVFMIRGIRKKWKQPIAYYFTRSAANSSTLKTLILQVVRAVHEKTKFKIIASVCDGGSWNVAALRGLTIDSGRDQNDFVYNVDGHEIIHLFDAPHLLKCMRNNFMTKDIIFRGKIARWAHIQSIFEKDGLNGTFKVTKLTNAHVNPSSRQKMKVKLAAQVFSHSTAAHLRLLTNYGVIDADGTAEFVKFMNDLFDSMNSVTMSAKPLACKVMSGSPHFQFWLKARGALSEIKFVVGNNPVSNPPFLQLLLSTLRNMKYLWDSLENCGFQYLTMRAVNQDPLENLFSVARGLCGGNSRPSTTQFVDAYKTAILNNTVRCSIGSNCEDDGENLLLSYQILLSHDTPGPSDSDVPQTPSTLFSQQSRFLPQSVCDETLLARIDIQTGAYVAGYLIKKLLNHECELCVRFFCADTITSIHDLTRLKDYGEGETLLLKYANDDFIKIVVACKDAIFSQIPNIITNPDILSDINVDVLIPHSFCPEHGEAMKARIIKLISLVLTNHFVKTLNKKIRGLDAGNNPIIENFYKLFCGK